MRDDALRNRVAVVAAAARLFDSADVPSEVTMDAVALEAGVGKGTVFRAVGNRDGLLEAVFELRAGEYYAAFETLDLKGSPAERALRLMSAIVAMKERNRGLFAALDGTTRSPYDTAGYKLGHESLRRLLEEAGRGEDADFLAHILFASVRSDLMAHLQGGAEVLLRGIDHLVTALFSMSHEKQS